MIECVRIPIFDVDVYFVTSEAEAREFITAHSPDGEADAADATDRCRGVCYIVTDKEGQDHRLMCVFDGKETTAVHEAVHMAWRTLRHCGVKFSMANDEPLALLTEWLAGEMIRRMKV